MALLEARGLAKVYGAGRAAVRAVDGVDLTIDRGEVVLIMGPSGSGKTTLLFLLGGLLRPTSGRILVEGEDVSSLPERKLSDIRRKNFGFIFQDFNLLSALTAQENVEVALNLAGLNGGRARQEASALLGRVGLAERAAFLPEKLSGGEKQRVSIARALANEPSVILADEPTANLDSRAGRDAATILEELTRSGRRSVVIVSHDARIVDIADRIFLMEDGRISQASEMRGGVDDGALLDVRPAV